jgi:hypothetical protein
VVERLDVAEVVDRRERRVGHPELFALVDVGRASVQVEDRPEQLRRADAMDAVVAEARDGARLVVVVPVEAVPPHVRESDLPAVQRRLELAEVQRADVPLAVAPIELDMLELEDHVDLATPRVGVQPRLVDRHARHLADVQQPAAVRHEDLPVHLLQELVDPRPVEEVRCPVAQTPVLRVAVGQRRVLGDHVDDVHPEPVDPAVKPPAHHREHGLADLGVLPVEIGLLPGEEVQVVLAVPRVELPGRSREERAPVRRLGARLARGHSGARRPPPVPVALGVVAARARLDEPGVLVGRVVDDEVHHELHAALVRGAQQRVELLQRAERGVDVLVVADVIARVVLR